MLKELDDYDWKETFGEPETNNKQEVQPTEGYKGNLSNFTREDVELIRHIKEGEADGENWYCCGKLKDGRWFTVEGGCDYTGWYCQSFIRCYVADSYENICRWGMSRDTREEFGVLLNEEK